MDWSLCWKIFVVFRPLLCLVLFPCQDPSAAGAGSNLLVFHFALMLWQWPSVLLSPTSQCSPSYSPTEPSKESHKNCTKKHTKPVKNCFFFLLQLRSTEFFLPSSSRMVGDCEEEPLLCWWASRGIAGLSCFSPPLWSTSTSPFNTDILSLLQPSKKYFDHSFCAHQQWLDRLAPKKNKLTKLGRCDR